jgi:hypothetical protein
LSYFAPRRVALGRLRPSRPRRSGARAVTITRWALRTFRRNVLLERRLAGALGLEVELGDALRAPLPSTVEDQVREGQADAQSW